MVPIRSSRKKDATTLHSTRREGINLISTNFIYTNRIKSILYNTPIAIRIATKGSRSILAAYVILLVQLKGVLSFNA
jgi:hypothetical protein